MTAFLLTRPITVGNSGSTLTNQTVVIPAHTTVLVDLVDTMSAKWFYTLLDSINSKGCSGEILGMHRYGSNPTNNVSNIIGDKISHSPRAVINAGKLGLEITNNTAFDLVSHVVRIQIINV